MKKAYERRRITMKTLILISHPQFEDSGTQQFLKTSFYSLDDVKYQVIDELYTATGTIDIEKEQNALRDFDRIVFQFPMYWYSSPASLKRFMDDVFTRNYIVAKRSLKTKELGIVVSLGTLRPTSKPAARSSLPFPSCCVRFRHSLIKQV